VQPLPSSQLGGLPGLQVPPPQTSRPLQTVPSSHGFVLLACWQPFAASQESSVQTLPSSQLGAVPGLQVPAPQTSRPLQTVPSSHGLVLFVCWQSVAGWVGSSVQTLPSSQLGAVPGLQVPPPQTSRPLQTVPSSHGLVLLVCWQPLTASQESSVQMLPSSQLGAVPGLQVPPPQTSRPLQTVPSSHGLVLFVCW